MAIVSRWRLRSDGADSVGVNNGTVTSVTFSSGGPVGRYGVFSSSGASKVLIPDSNTLSFTSGVVTHSFFVRKDDTVSAFIMSKNGATASEWTTYFAAGNSIASTFYNSSQGVKNQGQAAGAITAGKWYHIIMTHNGSTPDIFVDGNKKTVSVNAGSGTIINTTEPVSIGRREHDSGFPLNGGLCYYTISDNFVTAGKAKNEYLFLRGYI